MKKFLPTFLAGLLLVALNAKAQKGSISLSVGPLVSIAIIQAQSYKSVYKTGFGAGVGAFYNTTKNSAISINFNYIKYASKLANIDAKQNIALNLGYQSYVTNSKLFAFGNLSFTKFASNNNTVASSSFGSGLGLGYSIIQNKKNSLNIAPSFDIYFGSSSVNTWLNCQISYKTKL